MTPTPSPDDLEAAVGQIAGEFTDRIQRGDRPEIEDYISRYPALAGVLREVLPAVLALGSSTQGQVELPARIEPMPERVGLYDVIRDLGRGGMGVVYLARDRRLDRLVALKLLRWGLEDRERFLLEGQSAARLRHPHIVAVHEVGEHDGRPFLALEYVSGGNLAEYLAWSRLTAVESARLIERVADAVQCAHDAGIVHRDLKPGNILLENRETGPAPNESEIDLAQTNRAKRPLSLAWPKVTDFGLAKRLDDLGSGRTHSGAIVGTPGYMAPEQAGAASRLVGPSADIYALGAVLYECLTGKPPFRGESTMELLERVRSESPVSPRRIDGSIPRDLETVCLKCLNKSAHERYDSAAALGEDLRRFLDGRPVVARPLGPLTRTLRSCRRQPVIAGLVAMMVALVLSGLVTFGLLWWKAESNLALAEQRERDLDSAVRFADEQRRIAEARGEQERINFGLAQEAVDEMLSQVGEGLENVPHASLVRRRVLEKALALQQKFLSQRSDDPRVRLEVGRSYRRVAHIHMLLGNTSESYAAAEAGRSILSEPAQLGDLDAEYESAQLIALIASLNFKQKNLPAAVEQGKNAMDLLAHVRTARPQDEKLRMTSVHVAQQHGLYLTSAGKFDAATAAYELALKLLAETHDTPEVRYLTARTHNRIGTQLRTTGKLTEADERWQQVEEIMEMLLAEQPDVRMYRQELSSVLLNHGNVVVSAGPTGATRAQTYYSRSYKHYQDLARDFPRDPSYRSAMGNCLFGRGLAHARLNRPIEARDDYLAGAAIFASLQADYPGDYRYHEDELRLRLNLFDLLLRNRELPAAGDCLARLRQLAAILRDGRTDSTTALYLDGQVTAKQALFLGANRQYEESIPVHEAALLLLQECWSQIPRSIRYRQAFTRQLLLYASTLKRLERSDDLRRLAGRCSVQFPDYWALQLVSAEILCHVLALESTSPTEQDELAELALVRLHRALELSQKHNEAGYLAVQIREYSDLAPLRDRPAFQALLELLPQSSR